MSLALLYKQTNKPICTLVLFQNKADFVEKFCILKMYFKINPNP